MAVGDRLLKTDLKTINANGRNASIDVSIYSNNSIINQRTYIKGFNLINTTMSNITLSYPKIKVNGKDVEFPTNSFTISANSSRWLSTTTTGSYNEMWLSYGNVMTFSMGSNIPQGIVFGNANGIYDSSNKETFDNVGVEFNIQYYQITDRPRNLTLSGTSNIYEDITINGVLPSGSQYFGIMELADGDITRYYQGYTDRSIFKAGYFKEAGSRSIVVRSFRKLNGDKYSYGDSYTESITVNLTAVKPTLSSVNVDTSILENPITVSWTAPNQSKYELEVLQNDVVIYSKSESTPVNRWTIPKGTFNNPISTVFRVRVMKTGNIAWSDWSSTTRTLEYEQPTISNLSNIGNQWERPITINWRSTLQSGYEYELYYNNIRIKTGNGTTSTTFNIAANTFTGTLPASVRVRVGRNVGGQTIWTNWVERSISLQDITATVSNLIVNGEYWEKDIKLSWQSSDQQQFKVEVLKENTVIKTYTGTTDNQYTIPANTLESGEYTFKVWVAYANRFINSQSKNSTLKDITPTISNLSLSGSNIDLDLALSWESTDQQTYKITISKDSSTILEYTGATETSKVIPHNTLGVGLYTFKVDVFYKNRVKSASINATLVETFPSIGVLEPDGVIVERDNPIRIWWTSQNQSKWKIKIDGELLTYTGTTEKEKILSPATLSTGPHTIVLDVTYITGANVEKTISKKAEFIVQGKPPRPTITSAIIFANNRPTITWDTQDQQGYILEVLKDDKVIYTTDWQNGLITEHKIMDYIESGTYTARIKVMNQYSLESDYGTKQFTVNSKESAEITLKCIEFKNHIHLSWGNVGGVFSKFYILRNNMVIAKTTDTLYDDYSALGECIYTIRGITNEDAYKDSNKVYATLHVANGIAATIDSLDDIICVGISRNEFSFDGDIGLEAEQIYLSGRELPVTVFGEHRSGNYNINFTSKELFRFLDMCKRRQPFLYRDKRQKLYLTITNPNYKVDRVGLVYSIQATEVDYSEVVEYD